MSQDQLPNFSEKIKNDLKKMNQWPALVQISQALNGKNRLCWISGGAVRDIILSRTPLDFDLTTDATEEEILALFPSAILVGQQFGVYKIPIKGEVYDLTVFREEDEYIDGRRPVAIRRSTPVKDAERRDFTMNGLFWDLKNETLIDYVDGLKDIAARTVRCVGQPTRRFDEDYLRVLRMIRFSYALDFEMDAASYRAGLDRAASLVKISGERILAEILKLSEMDSRLSFYADPLFMSIMKHNDLSLLNIDLKLAQLRKTHSVERLLNNDRTLFEILFLLGFEFDNVKKIQSRLKIGNDEKKWLMKCCEMAEVMKDRKDFVTYCLLIDKSPDYLVLIHYFKALGLLDESIYDQVVKANEKFPASLIKAQDILHLVPVQMLSKVLIYAREWQLRNQITDRDLVMNYIRSKDLT
ncbi:MAG: CCA tRNA nucleotidyltransferase [Bdellovibrionaceae bacterium]|nr:CCA tRNA nucleotidyltransferase [Pseudobdellovibrionaceae bacterium]